MKQIKYLLPLIFLLLFTSSEFFLLLRHKSPYLSDSHFYRHIAYQIQGDSFDQAYEKVLAKIDLEKIDEREKNFYLNKDVYKDVMGFFTKRPLYPLIVAFLLNIIGNEYLALLIPIYIGYFLLILSTIYLFKEKFTFGLTFFASGLFISFYPLLDWSTYFLTDTIGACLWTLQLICLYRFLQTAKNNWLITYVALLVLSLLNREQSLLMGLVVILLYVLLKKVQTPINVNLIKKVMIATWIIISIYVSLGAITKQKNLYDTIVYTQNDYGLHQTQYTLPETFKYMTKAIAQAHKGLIQDLSQRHLWFIFTGLGILSTIIISKRRKIVLIDAIFIASMISSYAAIYLYPVLSYRYFFPTIAAICYFAVAGLNEYFETKKSIT